ncbi:hypothetical protein M413DRAFT_408695 [Hebeloma cylindrosporum]|uniref:Uncharacterized protein n=1 Tax=Hebeloma cylindrosporum TaxID=76867 RepID=A0A0C3CGG9_HEBCY|nr:hypothetical protein M413DRAFT_408695 [Hebeloma cylindrosporum h7]
MTDRRRNIFSCRSMTRGFLNGHRRRPYEVVLAVLKLSTKYEVGYLRKRALAHLSLAYPLSLDQWDKRETVSTLSAENDVDAWLGSKATSKTLNVIAAAEGLNLPWLLPALFYELSTATLELLLHDSKWNDGSIDPKTKHNILVGYYEQTNATQSRMLNFLYCDPLERCSSKDVCGEVRRRVYCDSQIWLKTKPLEVMEDGDWDPFLGDLCALCLQVSKVRFQQARQEFWETLPEIYGLPKWEVLVGLHEDDVGQSQAMLQVGD